MYTALQSFNIVAWRITFTHHDDLSRLFTVINLLYMYIIILTAVLSVKLKKTSKKIPNNDI